MLKYNNWLSRLFISLAFGVPSYFMLFLIRGYPIEEITNYAFWQYSGIATTTFLLLFEIQNLKSAILEKHLSWERKFTPRLLTELVTSLLLTVTLVSLASWIIYVIVWQMQLYRSSLMLYYSLVFLISLTFMVFVNAQYIISYWKQSLSRANELQKENISARLEALQNQLSPHFLFNNFSILNGLIDQNPVQAKEFTSRLSDVFRYILNTKSKETVPLKKEIGFLKDYSYVLKARFGKKIDIQFDEKLTLQKDHIPPVSLQQLVENAVKHNETSFSHPLKISISSDRQYLYVSNKKRMRKTVNSHGTGLKNLTERYKFLTDLKIKISDTDDQFSVGLPLLKINIDEYSHN